MPARPPDWIEILRNASPDAREQFHFGSRDPAPEGRYRHWETLRRIHPADGLTVELTWALLKAARTVLYRELPLTDVNGYSFRYALVDPVLARLHQIDRDASGQISFAEAVIDRASRDRYVFSSLVEEAVTSSQIEGAATTRVVAKEMLRSGRKPRTPGERMILGNFRAMEFVRERRNDPLTPTFIFQLHQVIMGGTGPGGVEALRKLGDGIAVFEESSNQVLHRPPEASQVHDRLGALCEFANNAETGAFLHPVLKAIVLHFWLAYDHPFVDGNGRTARALFYWGMLREGFWLAEFISISGVIRKAPARYGKSFLYTETDDNDLTYFVLAQLRVIEQAIGALKQHLQGKLTEARVLQDQLGLSDDINPRQEALLAHAIRHPNHRYTFAAHQRSHGVVYATARADLLNLAEAGLLVQSKRGRKFIFTPPSDLMNRIKSVSKSS